MSVVINQGAAVMPVGSPSLAPHQMKLLLAMIDHDRLYRQRHRIENIFGKLKASRRIHTRYDRCAHTFVSATCKVGGGA